MWLGAWWVARSRIMAKDKNPPVRRLTETAWTVWTVASGAVCQTHTDQERNEEEGETWYCAVVAAKATRTDVSAHEETALGILVEGPGRTAAPPPVRGWLWSSRGHPGADRPGAAAPSRQGCVGRRAGKGLVSHRAAGFNRATT